MPFSPTPGIDARGKFFSQRGLFKRNVSGDIKAGSTNPWHYLDLSAANGGPALTESSDIAAGALDCFGVLTAADAEGPITLTPGTYLLSQSLSLANKIRFQPGAIIKPAASITLTLNASFEARDDQQIFDTSAAASAVVVNGANHVTADHFGATAASSTNLVYFQRARACATASGISVKVPSNEYTIETAWSVTANDVEIIGEDGRKSVLKFTTGYLGFSACASPRVDNLTVEGSDQDSNGIYLLNGTANATVSNCTVRGFDGTNGAIVFEGVSGCTCVGNSFEDNNGGSTQGDIIFTTCKDIICIGNRCVSANGTGISVDNNPNDLDVRFVVNDNIVKGKSKHGVVLGYSADILRGTVIGNVLYDCAVTGMYVQAGASDSSGAVTITGNNITFCGGSEPTDDAGNCAVYLSGNGGTFTGNYIGDSGYDPTGTPRGSSLGRSVLFGHIKNWTVTGNTFKNSVNISLDFLSQNTAKNILVANNILIDGGTALMQIANSGTGFTKNFNVLGNTFQRTNTDGVGLSIFEVGGQGTDITVSNNDFRGRRLAAGIAAINWPRENYQQTLITGNRFYNWDKGLSSTFNTGATVEDWAFGETVHVDSNLFDNVTVPFDLRASVFNAVGSRNRFVSCDPGFSNVLVPASISSGILEGYYVSSLPTRRCRPNDRLKPLYSGLGDATEWLNSAQLPAPTAFVVSAGNVFDAVAHGFRVRDRIRAQAGGSLPTPIEAGVDYYVASVPTADTFTVSRYNSWDTLDLTGTGSGDFQNMGVTPVWVLDEFPLARANHTGTQTASTISDFDYASLAAVGETTYDQLLLTASSLLNGDADLDGAGDADDVIGTFNGTWGGTPAYGIAPIATGKSFVLNGTTNYISQVSDAGDLTDNFTVAAWVKATALTANMRIVSKRDTPTAWELFLNADGSVSLYTGTTYSSAAGAITVDTWHHVAMVINGASSQIYIDGVASGAAFSPTISANAIGLYWGSFAGGGAFFWNGELFQCGIVNAVLTADDIALLHNPNLATSLHTHVASDITDFDAEVSNNADVTANTAKVTNATHTGHVTGSGALTIATGVVTNTMLADMPEGTVKGRIDVGAGDPEDLTAAQGRAWLSVADTSTTAALTDIGNAINTTNKFVGKRVWNTTATAKPFWAVGSAAGDGWADATGAVIHTPV